MSDWLDVVIEKTNKDKNFVKKVLEDNNIFSSSIIPKPKQLKISYLEFTGTKTFENKPEKDFSFKKEFSKGIYCFATDEENHKGKSSILAIILWALSGRASYLQDDIKKWIKTVCIKGYLDDECFIVSFENENRIINGTLKIINNDKERAIKFKNDDEFEEKIGEYMLNSLQLTRIPYWQKYQGDEVLGTACYLSWPAYIKAFLISSAKLDAIIGEHVMAGQAGSLLSLYIGLPWLETNTNLKVAIQKANQHVNILKRVENKHTDANQEELDKLNKELASLKEKFNDIPATI